MAQTMLHYKYSRFVAYSLALSMTGVLALSGISRGDSQLLTVKFINGKNGKSIESGRRVWVSRNNADSTPLVDLDLHTDREGAVSFSPGAMTFHVVLVGFVPCGEQPIGMPRRNYSVNDIVQHGLVTKNDCGNMPSEAIKGRLLYFVRPVKWSEWLKE